MADALLALGLLTGGVAYGAGVRRAWRAAGQGRLVQPVHARLFTAGLVAVAASLLPPLAERAEHSLTAHMVQHVLLLTVAAPLLVMGAPLPTLLWALPRRLRELGMAAWRSVLMTRRGVGWTIWAASALVVQAAVMWAWHAPDLYDAALRNNAVHAAEHSSFLAVACLFWWAVGLAPGPLRSAAVPFAFAGAVPGTALGAALTLASVPWYPAYPSLEDQQLAGVVMWAFAGFAYVVAAAVLFGAWLAASDRVTPPRPLPATGRARARA